MLNGDLTLSVTGFRFGKQTGVDLDNQWPETGTKLLFVDTLTQVEGWRKYKF
jgi:hypothetical protein